MIYSELSRALLRGDTADRGFFCSVGLLWGLVGDFRAFASANAAPVTTSERLSFPCTFLTPPVIIGISGGSSNEVCYLLTIILPHRRSCLLLYNFVLMDTLQYVSSLLYFILMIHCVMLSHFRILMRSSSSAIRLGFTVQCYHTIIINLFIHRRKIKFIFNSLFSYSA